MKRRRGLPTPQRLDKVVLRVQWTDRANRTTTIEVPFYREGCEANLERFVEAVRKGDYVVERHYVTSELPA